MKACGKILLYLVIALAIIPLFCHFYMSPVLGDEGILAMDGWRIARGEVPHRDFFQFIPPLAAYVQALFFKLLSPSVFAVRLLGTLYGVVLVILTFFLYRKFLKTSFFLALSLSILVPYGVAYWQFGSHHWLCDILQIAGMIFLLSSLGKKSMRMPAISGILFGLAVFTLQDQGGYGVIGLAAASLLVSKETRKLFLVSALSAAVTFLLLSLPLALLASPGQLIRDWIYFPIFNYAKPTGNQAGAAKILGNFIEKWNYAAISANPFYGISKAISASLIFLTPVLSVASLVLLFMKKLKPRPELLILTVFSLSFLFGAFHRLALTNLVWAFPALLPFYILLEYLSGNSSKALRRISFSVACFLLSAILLFGVLQIYTLMKKEGYSEADTPAGRYVFYKGEEARSFNELIREIENNVPGGEPLFCVGYIPLVNFASRRPNPTRYNFMIPGGYYSNQQVFLWMETLERSQLEWGISEREIMDEARGQRLLPNYKVAFKNDKYFLWRKR